MGENVIHQYWRRFDGQRTKFFPSLFLYQDLQEVEKFLFRVHSPIFDWNSLVLSQRASTDLNTPLLLVETDHVNLILASHLDDNTDLMFREAIDVIVWTMYST